MSLGAEALWATPRRPPVAARGRWRLAVLAAVLTALSTGTMDLASPRWQNANIAMAAALKEMGYHYRFLSCSETCWLGRKVLVEGETFRVFRQREQAS